MLEGRKSGDLPDPTEGITDEVLAELRTDRDRFVEETLTVLSDENKPLESFLTFARQHVMRSDDLMDWTLAYYAIVSRSARNQGIPMIGVSQSVIDKVSEEGVLRGNGARARGMNPTKFLEESMDMVGTFAQEDGAKSKELKSYWNNFFNFMADSTTPATRVPSIQLGVATSDFANIIKTQHNIKQGKQPFPNQN
ncbi:MAG TPA: hypothetical protein VNA13_03645 [Xanthomonadales bacterium]|nr:hypothetical protein [Xanthomonadales bacterium]